MDIYSLSYGYLNIKVFSCAAMRQVQIVSATKICGWQL